MDMNSIKVTDIPADQPVPLKNLTNLLAEEFEVKIYSRSFFEITAVQYHTQDSFTIVGNLKIKSRVNNISVPAHQSKRFGVPLFSTPLE